MPALLNSANGAILLTPQDGTGQVNLTLPRVTPFNNGNALFAKQTRGTRLFASASANVVTTAIDFIATVAGLNFYISAGTNVAMPALVAGTDYAFYLCSDGTLRADASFSYPSGYTTANSRFIGCGHYAPGGNAAAQTGGSSTPAFNPYSLFDLTFRPRRSDWRGMATDPGLSVCGMIYPLNTNHITLGPSAYNATIATGAALPLIPTQFGGNGSTAYSTADWWNLGEILSAYGMRHPDYREFAALAYGTTENSSMAALPTVANLQPAYTSKCGIIQATGCIWVWGKDWGGGAAAASWTSNNDGRGQTYQMENVSVFGGTGGGGASSGSRASAWSVSASASGGSVGARGVCDLLILD